MDVMEFRKPYQDIIKNLVANADQCSKQYIISGDPDWLTSYKIYVKKIEELKSWIKSKEIECS